MTVETESVVIEGVEFAAALTLRSDIGLIALHGTKEGGTAELAHEVAARTGASCLVFTQPAGDLVHIPSHRMAAPHCETLQEFLASVTLVISLHGHRRPEAPRSIFLGGGNRAAAATLAHSLVALAPAFDTVTDMARIPGGLRGLHPGNPVNLTRSGGVQIELPLSARTRLPAKPQGAPDVPPRPVTAALAAGVGHLGSRPRG
ncbi:poly-gamma-glutamate hydrolase family protein [Streptomyces griseochromogenes]|uniref:poly-gamma-glutamate hydrolase family protein n=1 Tax=Streptomyces griseochromogenes TaxID=68214 RepID=UPI0037B28B9B